MIKIRLVRKGRKKSPFYGIVAIESRSKMAANPLGIIGYWNPRGKKEGALKVDKDKLSFWLKTGAKETAAVKKLLSQRSEGGRYPERKLAGDSSDL